MSTSGRGSSSSARAATRTRRDENVGVARHDDGENEVEVGTLELALPHFVVRALHRQLQGGIDLVEQLTQDRVQHGFESVLEESRERSQQRQLTVSEESASGSITHSKAIGEEGDEGEEVDGLGRRQFADDGVNEGGDEVQHGRANGC